MITREQCLKWADDCGFSFFEGPTSAQIEALCQRVWNEAMGEAAKVCEQVLSADEWHDDVDYDIGLCHGADLCANGIKELK